MNQSKQTIFEKLDEIEGVQVYQLRPKTVLSLPCVIFQLSDLSIVGNLDKEIADQSEEYTIDIFAVKTNEASSILASVEEKMRELGYILTGALDIPDPDFIAHTNARFNLF